MNTILQRVAAEQANMTRAEQRKQRLLEAESELAREEAEALKMTEEQRQVLFGSFADVMAEFSDLDGLRWTQTALRKLQSPYRRAPQHSATSHSPSKNTFLILSNSDLTSRPTEDTIRVTSSAIKNSSLTLKKSSFQLTEVANKRRDGTRSRSPIKGLFPSLSSSTVVATSHSTDATMKVSLPESDIADGDDYVGDTDSCHGAHQHNMHLAGPPGLSPAPTYDAPSFPLTPSVYSVSFPMGGRNAPQMDGALFPSVEHDTAVLVPLPHRDAPSPPSSQTPITIPSISVSTPAVESLTDSPSIQPSLKPQSYCIRTARTRLHSLLRDVCRPSMPSTTPSRSIRISTAQTSPEHLAIPLAESCDLTEFEFLEDDETPRPSPVAERSLSPSIPWVQSIN